MNPVFRYVRSRLQRRLFLWFGLTIVLTAGIVFSASRLVDFGDSASPMRRLDGVRSFLGRRFAEVWDDEEGRARLASDLASDLDANVALDDASGRALYEHGRRCRRSDIVAVVVRRGVPVGRVHLCFPAPHGAKMLRAALPFVLALGCMWVVSGAIARRLSRPFVDLARVAEEIGAGNLKSRMHLRRRGHATAEVQLLSSALGTMASRIEAQLEGQRALLAAVSHEIRTPLARMRILVEMGRTELGEAVVFDKLDGEVQGIDHLVGDLLANARVDFSAVNLTKLDGVVVAEAALARAELEPSLLVKEGKDVTFSADANLIARALDNLLSNARVHAGAVARLRVRDLDAIVSFEVDDDGPGFHHDETDKVFEPFYKREKRPTPVGQSIGLGLSLVRRIAEAHGGRAFAENRTEGGATVGIHVAKRLEPKAAVRTSGRGNQGAPRA